MAAAALLDARDLHKSFGGVKAVQGASIQVETGTITGLIGPNGAGKTTLFNLLSNFIHPDRGTVTFAGREVQAMRSHHIARLGMVRTFQVARALSRLSVLENMLLGAHPQVGEKLWDVWLRPGAIAQQQRELKDKAMGILADVGLDQKAQDYAGALSGGQRKLLEIARALMADPQLILLDEPAAGVNPALIDQICDRIQFWNQQGLTFLIVEHNMDVIMSLCDHVWVLAEGQNLADGSPEQIQQSQTVLEAYLGDTGAVGG